MRSVQWDRVNSGDSGGNVPVGQFADPFSWPVPPSNMAAFEHFACSRLWGYFGGQLTVQRGLRNSKKNKHTFNSTNTNPISPSPYGFTWNIVTAFIDTTGKL